VLCINTPYNGITVDIFVNHICRLTVKCFNSAMEQQME